MLPDIAGTRTGPLLILGDARCVWDDVEALGAAKPGQRGTIAFDGAVMCVNMIGLFVERFDCWYSNDGRWLQRLAQARRPEWAKMYPGRIELHTSMPTPGDIVVWDDCGPGSSSLNAAKVGVRLGHAPVILCGVPLDDSGHNGEPVWKSTNFTREVADAKNGENGAWKNARMAEFDGKVRSMSGRTREWLGGPS